MRGAARNFCHLKLAPPLQKDKINYAHPPGVSGGDLYNKESFFPNDDFLRSALINEELSDSMSFTMGGSMISIL